MARQIKNAITRETPASFDPTIDYVVTKIPRFAFEKFPQGLCRRPPSTFTAQMKSVGEAMAIGRPFKESLQKCLRSLETRRPCAHQPQRPGRRWQSLAHRHGSLWRPRTKECVTTSLTLALSPRRGNRLCPSSDCPTTHLPSPPHDIPRNQRTILLLPGGEGRDEGER